MKTHQHGYREVEEEEDLAPRRRIKRKRTPEVAGEETTEKENTLRP